MMNEHNEHNPCEQPLEEALIEGLTELRDALQAGESLEKRFTMRTVDLDLSPKSYSVEDVVKTRSLLSASQSVFAQLLGVSPKTVQSWEQGGTVPNPTASRLMDLINADPEQWLKLLESAVRQSDHTPA